MTVISRIHAFAPGKNATLGMKDNFSFGNLHKCVCNVVVTAFTLVAFNPLTVEIL